LAADAPFPVAVRELSVRRAASRRDEGDLYTGDCCDSIHVPVRGAHLLCLPEFAVFMNSRRLDSVARILVIPFAVLVFILSAALRLSFDWSVRDFVVSLILAEFLLFFSVADSASYSFGGSFSSRGFRS
jgi:hypothetical protein